MIAYAPPPCDMVPPSPAVEISTSRSAIATPHGQISDAAIAPAVIAPPETDLTPQWSPRLALDDQTTASKKASKSTPQSLFINASALMPATADTVVETPVAVTTASGESPSVQTRPLFSESVQPVETAIPIADSETMETESASDVSNEDLGEIQILRPREIAPPPQPPIGRLLVQTSAFASTNITGLEEPSTGGYPLGTSATLLLTPPLGPDTRLVASAGAGLTRFLENGSSNYNSFDFAVGVQHQLNREMYGRIGWSHRRLYRAGSGDELSSTHAVNLTLGRQDRFSDDLRLDSFYRLQAYFVGPDDFSRLTNTLGANLRYALSPRVEGSVGYQLSLEDYTQAVRFDTKHRLRAGVTYRPGSDVYVSGLLSYLFGTSSDDDVALDGLSVGLVFGYNLPLF